MKNIDYLSEKIRWSETFNPEYPYKAVHNGKKLVLRLNNFPAEPLYTLMIDGVEITDIDEFSEKWTIKKALAYNTSAAD